MKPPVSITKRDAMERGVDLTDWKPSKTHERYYAPDTPDQVIEQWEREEQRPLDTRRLDEAFTRASEGKEQFDEKAWANLGPGHDAVALSLLEPVQ